MTPYLLIGTVHEVVDQLMEARRQWGITYFTVRDAEEFAPVLAAVRRRGLHTHRAEVAR